MPKGKRGRPKQAEPSSETPKASAKKRGRTPKEQEPTKRKWGRGKGDGQGSKTQKDDEKAESNISDELDDITPLRVTESDFLKPFVVDSDSDEETFAPMQATVDDLLLSSSVLGTQSNDARSPSAFPRGKEKGSKRGAKRKGRKPADTGSGSEQATDSPIKAGTDYHSTTKKSASDMFAEMMGEI